MGEGSGGGAALGGRQYVVATVFVCQQGEKGKERVKDSGSKSRRLPGDAAFLP